MKIDRRIFLATTCGVFSGGCLASRGGADDGMLTERSVENIHVSMPKDSSLSINTTITHAQITPDRTAQFEIEVTWEGENSQSIGYGNEIPFSEPKYSDSPKGLLLFTADAGIKRRNDKEWLPKTQDDGSIFVEHDKVFGTLSSGESVTESWTVWGDPRHVPEIKSGSYQFNNTIALLSENGDEKQVSWGMDVTIK